MLIIKILMMDTFNDLLSSIFLKLFFFQLFPIEINVEKYLPQS